MEKRLKLIDKIIADIEWDIAFWTKRIFEEAHIECMILYVKEKMEDNERTIKDIEWKIAQTADSVTGQKTANEEQKIANLERRIRDLKKGIMNIGHYITKKERIQQDITNIKQDIANLKEPVNKQEIADIKQGIMNLRREIACLKQETIDNNGEEIVDFIRKEENIEKEIYGDELKIAGLEKEIADLEKEIADLEKEIADLEATQEREKKQQLKNAKIAAVAVSVIITLFVAIFYMATQQ